MSRMNMLICICREAKWDSPERVGLIFSTKKGGMRREAKWTGEMQGLCLEQQNSMRQEFLYSAALHMHKACFAVNRKRVEREESGWANWTMIFMRRAISVGEKNARQFFGATDINARNQNDSAGILRQPMYTTSIRWRSIRNMLMKTGIWYHSARKVITQCTTKCKTNWQNLEKSGRKKQYPPTRKRKKQTEISWQG